MKKIKTKARGWGKISLVLLIAGLLALGVFAAGCGGEVRLPAHIVYVSMRIFVRMLLFRKKNVYFGEIQTRTT